jgi:hypothetical protein
VVLGEILPVYSHGWSTSLRCKEHRLGRTKIWLIYIDSEICVIRISGGNNKENWYKRGLSGNNCKGKKKTMVKKQEGEINLNDKYTIGINIIQPCYG